MHESFHIADLIVKKIQGTLTPGEQQELESWRSESSENQKLLHRASDPAQQMEKLEVYRLFDKEKVWGNLEDELFGTKTVRFEARKILRYAAAILLPLLVAGGFAYIFLNNPSANTIAEIDTVVKPGSQKAMLVLSDGRTIELEPETSLASLKEGDASITNEKRLLSYTSEVHENRRGEEVFNELRTPRGGGYNLQLADGTEVWLNAGSSLIFPVSFQDSVRQVILEGEAYFEVSHNGKPFIVSTADMNTRVLGTSFNISAYPDDPAFKATLVEGKVMVGQIILAPNEQAIYIRSSAEITKKEVNASNYISWIKGKMEFHNEDLEVVMKRLARWYDFKFEFENTEAKDFHFSARLDREERLSTILEMLEMTTDVKFEYRENIIVVL